jgi:hypothetical protein
MFTHELPKLVLSMLATSVIYHLACLILIVPARKQNLLNDALRTQDEEVIKKAM